MIKHHPTDEMLNAYVSGWLNASMSIAVSAHEEMCPVCQQKVASLTAHRAAEVFAPSSDLLEEFDDMLANILADEGTDGVVIKDPTPTKVNFKGKDYHLPRAMRSLATGKWQHIGRISRARVQLEDDEYRTSLLHIAEGGQVPEHSHCGVEITLLLDGHFEDELGTYHPGDFMMLDQRHQHTPNTSDGCLCLTVVSDSLEFKHGFSKLLNPIGKLIY